MTRADRSFPAIVVSVLILAIVMLPVSFDFLKYLIAGLFSFICMSVLIIYSRGVRIPYTPVYVSIGVFTLVYVIWLLVGVRNNNELEYIFKDSAGFMVYWVFPILLLYIVHYKLYRSVFLALVFAAAIVALLNIAAFVAFYSVFDRLTSENLLATNAVLHSIGLNWELGASRGVLRGNTKAGHYLLFGLAVLFFLFIRKPRTLYAVLGGLLFVGILLDGHRALVVSTAIFLIMVSPLVLRLFDLYPTKSLFGSFVVASLLIVPFLLFVDVEGWFGRFGMLEFSGVHLREHQIPALMNEIGEKPILGHGFGSSAEVIRNEERPFMYEVDFLAVGMKLGVIGGFVYLATYIATISMVFARYRTIYGYVIFSLGIAYFFYMGTNGGFAMSPISAFFHTLLFVFVSIGLMGESRVDLAIGGFHASEDPSGEDSPWVPSR